MGNRFPFFTREELRDTMKIIDKTLLDETSAKAKQSPRLRMNHNFHEELGDPVNRLLNAMEPGSYIRPHRHLNPDKDEIFLLLRGRVVVFTFDDEGHIMEKQLIDPLAGVYGAEIKPGVWHCLLVLEPGSVVYEVKAGPFVALTPENMAPWSPDASDAKGAKEYMDYLASTL